MYFDYQEFSHSAIINYSAAAAGALSSFITSPLDMAKLRMQVVNFD
jgi:hypothetical protein